MGRCCHFSPRPPLTSEGGWGGELTAHPSLDGPTSLLQQHVQRAEASVSARRPTSTESGSMPHTSLAYWRTVLSLEKRLVPAMLCKTLWLQPRRSRYAS